MALTRNKFGLLCMSILAILTAAGLISLRHHGIDARNTPLASTGYDSCIHQMGSQQYSGSISACLSKDNKLYTRYSAQDLPRLSERKTSSKPNVVLSSSDQAQDLTTFLQNDYTGCDTGYYKVLRVVPDRFALMNYGCNGQDNDRTFIIAIKLADGWSLISPTNNMNEQGLPSCLLVDMFKVSKELTSQCYENTGYHDGSLRNVTYL